MYKSTFLIADVPVSLESVTSFPAWLCGRYRTDRSPELCLTTSPADIERERELTGDHSSRDDYVEALAVYRRFCTWAALRNMIMFHSSAVAVDGEGYLFAAPSGTGKSTHTRLWRELLGDRAVMINDDKPILKCTEGGIRVYGTPWNGSHNLGCCMSAPVRGICFLSQSPDNRIKPIPQAEAVPLLLRQTYVPAGKQETVCAVRSLTLIARQVPIWRLDCNISPEAAQISYDTMTKGAEPK